MNKPTEAQVKEFWEWCGFEWLPKGSRDKFHQLEAICYPDDGTWHPIAPPIDLNNLFRYAVPEYLAQVAKKEDVACRTVKLMPYLFSLWMDKMEECKCGFALALFWALWQVKEVMNGTHRD